MCLVILPVTLAVLISCASVHGLRRVANSREADTFTYLFQWKYAFVARECEEVLGPRGYRAVCVDPPNEHLPGEAWYWRYQPVSYQLNSRGGNESDFIDMVQRCNRAGVDVYADVLLNHMANAGTKQGRVGIAGTKFSNRNFSGLFAPEQFHHLPNDPTKNCALDGLTREKLQECDLLGLADLNTSLVSVQNAQALFLQRLSDIGVKGVRIDASRHMPAQDLGAILSHVTGDLTFAMMEHVMDSGCPVLPDEYFHVAPGGTKGESRHMEFASVSAVGEAFRFGDLSRLKTFGGPGFVPSEKAVTFTDNHDIQRHAKNHRLGHCEHGCIHFATNALFFEDGSLHTLANAFLLAHPYGYPCLMSSYNFTNSGAGPPQDVEPCSTGWICEHRQPWLLHMVHFRRAVAHAPLTAFVAEGATMAFAREGAGFIAINSGSHVWDGRDLNTTLPPGVYHDRLSGNQLDICNDSLVDLMIPSHGIIAILRSDVLSEGRPRCPRSLHPEPPPGTEVPGKCSMHEGCKGLSGNCCPHESGMMLACCAEDPESPPGTQAPGKCSMHEGCKGLSGNCCPHESGEMLACCAEVQSNPQGFLRQPASVARRRRRSPSSTYKIE